MKRNKSGISLITLVITIIIMIILAGAIILTLTNSGIFDKANDAVDKYNKKQQQIMDSLDWLDWEPGKRPVPSDWKDNVSAIVDGVPIPKGFVASPYGKSENYPAENTKDGGLVIYALTPEEIAKGVTDIKAIDEKDGEDGTLTEEEAHYVSLTTRNQFVWVPVDDFKNDFVRGTYYHSGSIGTQYPSNKLGSGFWELILDENNMPADNTKNTTGYVSEATLAEATAMYNSVAEYGGFYIGRYEVGKDAQGKTSITMGKYPYNYMSWGGGLVETKNDNGAVSQSRAFYPKDNNNYGVVSTLTYEVQWDTTLNWWTGKDLNNSTSYGNHKDTVITKDYYNKGAKYIELDMSDSDSDFVGSWASAETINIKNNGTAYLLTTGAFKNANVNNIYDMAGNLMEWTMEGVDKNFRVTRGGTFDTDGNATPVANQASDWPVSRRGYNYPTTTDYNDGFRPSLYIKYQ